MQNLTKQFCHENQNIIFTRADKENITGQTILHKKIKKITQMLTHTWLTEILSNLSKETLITFSRIGCKKRIYL